MQLCAAYDLVARAASPNNLAADQLLANLASQREAAKICGKEGFGRLALIGCGGTEEGETRSKLTLRNPEENNQAHSVFFFCQLPFCQPKAQPLPQWLLDKAKLSFYHQVIYHV